MSLLRVAISYSDTRESTLIIFGTNVTEKVGNPGTPAGFQARVGKDFWRKFRAKRRKKFSLPTLDLLAWVSKDRPAIT